MKKILFIIGFFLLAMTSCMTERETVYREPYTQTYVYIDEYPSYYGCYPYQYNFWYYDNWVTPYYWDYYRWYGYGFSWNFYVRPYHYYWSWHPHHHHHHHMHHSYHNFGHSYHAYGNIGKPVPQATVRRNPSSTAGSMSGTRPTGGNKPSGSYSRSRPSSNSSGRTGNTNYNNTQRRSSSGTSVSRQSAGQSGRSGNSSRSAGNSYRQSNTSSRSSSGSRSGGRR